MTDVTTAATGFASPAANTAADPFKVILKKAYEFGAEQGVGDLSREHIFNLVREGVLEGTIKIVDKKRGKKAKGAALDHIDQIAQRYLDGVVKKGGNKSKATQKNRLQTIGVWCADHQDTREQDNVWTMASAMVDAFKERREKGDFKTKFYEKAEVMLRIATVYTKDKDRTTPLTEAEIDHLIRRQSVAKDTLDWAKAVQKRATAELEANGGDDADEEFKAILEAANRLVAHIAPQFEIERKERAQSGRIEALIREGVLRRTKAGKVVAA